MLPKKGDIDIEKKMKSHKAMYTLLIILFLIIISVAALYIWQKSNIEAVMDAAKYSGDDIQQQIADSKLDVESELEQYDVVGLRDFTFEEEEQIRRGQLSVEEAVAKIMEESGVADYAAASDGNSSSLSNGGSSADGSTADNKASSQKSEKAVLTKYTTELYALKATYLGKIGNLIDEAKADRQSGTSTKALVSKYLGRAASLEKEADSQVEALLSELKTELNSMGADTSIIDTMRSAYENEKKLKKSYYLSLYNNKK